MTKDQSYLRVASVAELPPGKMKCVKAGARCLLIANVGGEFLAADDRCTHEEASLSAGALHGELVKCPLHGSRFDLRTGQALEEPATEPLRTYPVRITDGEIYVRVDD